MKQILLLTAFFITVNQSFAQDAYIEVLVSEKVEVKATKFTYEIELDKYSNLEVAFETLEDEPNRNSELEEPSLRDLETNLKAGNFDYRYTTDANYSVGGLSDDKGKIFVTANSIEEIARLQKVVEEGQHYSGKISNIEYEDADQYFNTVVGKLKTKARAQANMLVEAGQSLGKLLQVAEVDESNALMDLWGGFQNKIMSSLMRELGGETPLTMEEEITMRFRFELK